MILRIVPTWKKFRFSFCRNLTRIEINLGTLLSNKQLSLKWSFGYFSSWIFEPYFMFWFRLNNMLLYVRVSMFSSSIVYFIYFHMYVCIYFRIQSALFRFYWTSFFLTYIKERNSHKPAQYLISLRIFHALFLVIQMYDDID